MRSSYKKLGPYIREIDVRNVEDKKDNLLGVSTQKVFIESIANTVGTNFKRYKVVKKGQFIYVPDTSRRGDRIGLALLEIHEEALVSNVYTVFEVINHNKLLPEYLMMWFRRPEFDRYARYKSHGSVREIFDWDEMCDVELPVPTIEKQREIVREYHTIVDRIKLNEQLNQKLEETAQAIYKQWFVDFEFPISKEHAAEIGRPELEGRPYKSSGGKMVWNDELDQEIPEGWAGGTIGDYAKVKSGYAFKSTWWSKKGVPVIKIGSIQKNTINYLSVDYVSDEHSKYAKNYEVKSGDIVIAMTGATIGKIALVPHIAEKILVNQRVGMFNLGDAPIKIAPYLYCTLMQDYVQNKIMNVGGDSAQANISNGQIQDIRMLIADQNAIDGFNSKASKLFKATLSKISENNLLQNFAEILKERVSVTSTEAIA